MNGSSTLLRVKHLTVEFAAANGQRVQAVSDVDLDLARGGALGLVGESGCGKSSLARAIMQLPRPSSGTVWFDGSELSALDGRDLRRLRGRFQMIFQNPVGSLNPLRTVGKSIEAPLLGQCGGRQRAGLAREILAAVGLDPQVFYGRRPFQLSLGQCQRASIARALVTEPQLLVCDEPVSSLDVSIQAQIINLLRDVQRSRGLAMLFISHDLAVVRHLCDRVAVMYLGKLCELAPVDTIFAAPRHPYTRALLNAIPRPDPARPIAASGLLAGEPPSILHPPGGCRFRTRCPQAQAECSLAHPPMRDLGPEHHLACHFPLPESYPLIDSSNGFSLASPTRLPNVA